MLVVAGQILPSGYASQYQIRTVLGDLDQARGLDMLVVGDLLMDCMRRNLGVSRQAIEAALATISMRKFQAAGAYPAAMLSGRLPRRSTRRTPYFDGDDIAAPCCGAAATLVTSDEDLVAQVLAARSPRHAGSPVVEVLGVGEGSSNPSFLERQSPLIFATAIREAFAATADDARGEAGHVPRRSGSGWCTTPSPASSWPSCSGWASSWHRAVERMRDGWSNPYGGLLTFGHALGASGLVQVNKTQHVFSGDRRHLRPIPSGPGPLPGTLAFTTSVGGPLSHIVVSLFRGGSGELPQSGRTSPSAEWTERRRKLRRALPVHLGRVERALAGGGRPMLVEGATYVSIRSCLRALKPADISGLTFDGVEALVRPECLDEVRVRLRGLVSVVVSEAERLSSLFDVFRVLTDELTAMADDWRGSGWFSPEAGAMTPARLTERLKECLRVPLAILCVREDGRLSRVVQFLPRDGLGYEALEGVDLLAERDGVLRAVSGPDAALLLPWWNVHARRPSDGGGPAVTGPERLDALFGPGAESVREVPADLGIAPRMGVARAAPLGEGARLGRLVATRAPGRGLRRPGGPAGAGSARRGAGGAGGGGARGPGVARTVAVRHRPGREPAVDDRRLGRGDRRDGPPALRPGGGAGCGGLRRFKCARRWRPGRGRCSRTCTGDRRWPPSSRCARSRRSGRWTVPFPQGSPARPRSSR